MSAPILLRRGLATAVCLSLSAVAAITHAQEAGEAVDVSLAIPAGQFWVIGDSIPLVWQFRNETTDPLAFMWEGCCRVNGRLDAVSSGESAPVIPAGQGLGHMFAKAAVMQPGEQISFETRLGDWVDLQRSGEYRLTGSYVGVTAEQNPRVPPGIGLWRGQAASAPTNVEVITPSDYLKRRDAFVERRGLQLNLVRHGAPTLFEPSSFTVEITNAAKETAEVQWPNDFELWALDQSGRRVGNISTAIPGDYQPIELPPNGRTSRSFTLTTSELFEDKPFGDYTLFIDMKPSERGARVPSTIQRLDWSMNLGDTRELVEQAASGARIGLRNQPLKLLRLHLLELNDHLQGLARDSGDVSAPAQPLLKELALAACLKPYQPEPAQFNIPLTVTSMGRMALPVEMRGCFNNGASVSEAINIISGVRRHLGWSFGVALEPDPGAPLSAVESAYRQLSGLNLAIHLTGVQSTNSVKIVSPPSKGADIVIDLSDEPAYQIRGREGVSAAELPQALTGANALSSAVVMPRATTGAVEQLNAALAPLIDLIPRLELAFP